MEDISVSSTAAGGWELIRGIAWPDNSCATTGTISV